MSSPNAAPITGLRSGKFPDDRTSGPGPFPIPVDAEIHGGYRVGLNKDSPMRPHWDESFVFAYAGSHELVRAMEAWAEETRPGFWRSVREFAVDPANETKLRFDVSAARNISMWVEGSGQDGTWKGEGSGSTRFFAKFSSNWVSEDSSVFVKAIRDGRIQEELAADLYSRSTVPEMPPIEPFTEERVAVIVRATYVAEVKESNFLQRKLTSPLGGPDFYSRIAIGRQEFWGRAIQKSREVFDPWYEILLVDRDTGELPITISVWDEDHTDSAKDAHIDINPAAGLMDLKMIFRTADSSLSGDVEGMFNSSAKTFSAMGERSAKQRAVVRGYVSLRTVR
jgi:hypothetical protein